MKKKNQTSEKRAQTAVIDLSITIDSKDDEKRF